MPLNCRTSVVVIEAPEKIEEKRSSHGCPQLKIRKNDKFKKAWPLFGGVSIPYRHATVVANAPWKSLELGTNGQAQ